MGVKSPLNKDGSAVARIFAKMYYESRGFYGADFKLARLERRIDDAGKTQEFRAAFEEISGGSWVDGREDYDINSDDVIEALSRTGVMSEGEAERWYEKSESNDFSIDQLTDDIAKYTRRRDEPVYRERYRAYAEPAEHRRGSGHQVRRTRVGYGYRTAGD